MQKTEASAAPRRTTDEKKTIQVFTKLVAKSFQELVQEPEVFVANVDGDALYECYLASFPEGTNPIFRKRTEHDCSCCRQFIKRAGAVVAIKDGIMLRTVWDEAMRSAPGFYREVAYAMRAAVERGGVKDIFRVGKNERRFGAPFTRTDLDGTVVTWNHLHTGEIPARLCVSLPDTERGNYRTTAQVFERGLVELTTDAVDTVLGLIESGALYRGAEHEGAVSGFQKMQRAYLEGAVERRLFVWANAGQPASRFRNTVIGMLVQDLSEGKDMETAVKSFETKVAPQNYKRTTALITPGMVKKAMETIESLGLESALERRFATLADISVNDVLWVDGTVKPLMKVAGIAHMLMEHAASNKGTKVDATHAENVSMFDFMKALREATSMELLFEGRHLGNLMSLTAPVHPEPKQLFRWANDFAWSYGGNVADSIAERVKRAGGKTEGAALRVSLSWFNYDDLDLHVHEPPRGNPIFFGNKRGETGGTLDVDMNAGGGSTREAVENIVWMRTPPDGLYGVVVNNYAQREMSGVGFVVEVECDGKITHYSYNKAVRHTQTIAVVALRMKGGLIERVEPGDPSVESKNFSVQKWGLKTEQFVKVSAVTLSPNYWGQNAVGNKHTFFVIDGAKNDEPTRGFYNEFLHQRLEPHRKVFEVIADKAKCQPTDGQLSGLGFSSTKKDSFIAKVYVGQRPKLFNVHI